MEDPQNRSGSTPTDVEDQPAPVVYSDADRPAAGDRDTREVAKQEGEQVVQQARDEASEVAGTAREGALEVADEAKRQTVGLIEDARGQLHGQARQQADQLGQTLQGIGQQMHALADGRPEEAGRVPDYANRMADQVGQIGDRVAQLGFDGTVDELQRFARRRPGMFLLGAAAAGFAVSRLGRGAKDAEQPDGRTGQADPQTDRSLMSGPDRTARTGTSGGAPAMGTPPGASMPPSTAGAVPTDMPPPPPVVPAPDPQLRRGQP